MIRRGWPRADLVEGPFSHHPLISNGPAGLWTEDISMTCGCPDPCGWRPSVSWWPPIEISSIVDEIYLEVGGTDMEHLNEGGEEAT